MTNLISIYNSGSFISLAPQQEFKIVGSFAGTTSIASLVSHYAKKGSFRLGMISKKLELVAKELGLGGGEILEILLVSGSIVMVSEVITIDRCEDGSYATIYTHG